MVLSYTRGQLYLLPYEPVSFVYMYQHGDDDDDDDNKTNETQWNFLGCPQLFLHVLIMHLQLN